MDTVLRVLDLLIGLALIGVVLLQRSEGGGLGMGSTSNSFMSVRGTANFLTRLTGILAGLFMIVSLVLALVISPGTGPASIFDKGASGSAPANSSTAPGAPGIVTPPAAPANSAAPAVPPAQPALPAEPAPAPVGK